MQATMKSSQGGTTQEERLKPMLLGNVRAAVRYLKDREGGGVLELHTYLEKVIKRWNQFSNPSILKQESLMKKLSTSMTISQSSQTSI